MGGRPLLLLLPFPAACCGPLSASPALVVLHVPEHNGAGKSENGNADHKGGGGGGEADP